MAMAYDPESGEFRWRGTLSGRGRNAKVAAGVLAGCLDTRGYRIIGLDGKLYRAARLAWLYMTGEWPAARVDHEDLSHANDRWNNLRLATPSQNAANAGVWKSNTSGFKGVSLERRTGRWVAQISCDRRHIYLGSFDAPEEAHAAYVAAAKKHFGEFSRAA